MGIGNHDYTHSFKINVLFIGCFLSLVRYPGRKIMKNLQIKQNVIPIYFILFQGILVFLLVIRFDYYYHKNIIELKRND